MPYAKLKSDDRKNTGIEDVMLNYRYQALFESDVWPALAPRLSVILPTGEKKKGLGTKRVGYEFNLPVSKIVSDRWTVHLNAGLRVTPEMRVELAEGGLSRQRTLRDYTVGASAIYAVTPNFNLMCEFVSTWAEEINDVGRVDRDLSTIVSPGFRYALALPKARDMQVVFGLAAPLGLTSPAPNYGVIGYLSIEHRF